MSDHLLPFKGGLNIVDANLDLMFFMATKLCYNVRVLKKLLFALVLVDVVALDCKLNIADEAGCAFLISKFVSLP